MKRILQAALLLALPFSAHGLIGVDSDGNTTGAVIYANGPIPLLNFTPIVRKDGVEYDILGNGAPKFVVRGEGYFVRRQSELDIQVPIPFTIHPNSTMTVRVDLQDMILPERFSETRDGYSYDFRGINEIAILTPWLSRYGGFEPQLRWWDIDDPHTDNIWPVAYKTVAGGQALDSFVVFEITTVNNFTIPKNDELYISFPALAILRDTPGTIHVSLNYEHAGQQFTKTYTMRDAVKGMDLLEVSAIATDVTVDISGGGTRFKDGASVYDNGLVANIGKISAKSRITYTAPFPSTYPHIHTHRNFHLQGERVLGRAGGIILSAARANLLNYSTIVRNVDFYMRYRVNNDADFPHDAIEVYASPSGDCSGPTVTFDQHLYGPYGTRDPYELFRRSEDRTSTIYMESEYICVRVDGVTRIPEANNFFIDLHIAFPYYNSPDEWVLELGRIKHGVVPTLAYVPPAGGTGGLSGFVRVVNHSTAAATASITGYDDTGERFGPVDLALPASSSVQLTSGMLESGETSRGLPVGLGDGLGDWRLEFRSTSDIEAIALVRTPDRFMTSVQAVVEPEAEGSTVYPVATFNPGSNTAKVSLLRLVNPGSETAAVTISGIDDSGAEAPGGDVTLSIPVDSAVRVTAPELEQGRDGITGRLGDGAGKWRLRVSSDHPLFVMNLLRSNTDSGLVYVSNLSVGGERAAPSQEEITPVD